MHLTTKLIEQIVCQADVLRISMEVNDKFVAALFIRQVQTRDVLY